MVLEPQLCSGCEPLGSGLGVVKVPSMITWGRMQVFRLSVMTNQRPTDAERCQHRRDGMFLSANIFQ